MRGVSERGPAVNQVPHQIHNWASINEVVGSCPRVLHISFSCFLRVILSIRPRDRLGSLEGKVGSACEEFEDSESGISG